MTLKGTTMADYKPKPPLKEGFAYCEIRSASVTKKNGEPIVNSQGQAMVMLSLYTTDCAGMQGYVNDFICVQYRERFQNVENAFGVMGLYRNNRYFTDCLVGKYAGAVLKTSTYQNQEQSKVATYLPISFYKLMTTGTIAVPQQLVDKQATSATSDGQSVLAVDDDLPF
jgi:hypothetical protein